MHKKSHWPIHFLWGGFLFSCLLSCGKGFKDEDIRQDEVWQGQYQTVFKPLNQRFGRANGWSRISIYENQIWARIKFNGKKIAGMHAQYIHVQDRCPDMTDDSNRDGYLDFIEAYHVSGPILLPLDSNLNSQMKGLFEFPIMKRLPSYYYSEASNYSRMMEDLRREDTVIDDMMVKLHRGEDLSLERRAILIYGVDEDVILPPTVRSFTGYPPQRTLPIACGEIQAGVIGESY